MGILADITAELGFTGRCCMSDYSFTDGNRQALGKRIGVSPSNGLQNQVLGFPVGQKQAHVVIIKGITHGSHDLG